MMKYENASDRSSRRWVSGLEVWPGAGDVDSLHLAAEELKHGLLDRVLDGNLLNPNACRRELAHVRKHLEQHIRSTESTGGLLDIIDDACPRLASRVERLRQEHASLREGIASLQHRLEQDKTQGASSGQMCHEASGLLHALYEREAAEIDLMLEAFCSDVGTGD